MPAEPYTVFHPLLRDEEKYRRRQLQLPGCRRGSARRFRWSRRARELNTLQAVFDQAHKLPVRPGVVVEPLIVEVAGERQRSSLAAAGGGGRGTADRLRESGESATGPGGLAGTRTLGAGCSGSGARSPDRRRAGGLLRSGCDRAERWASGWRLPGFASSSPPLRRICRGCPAFRFPGRCCWALPGSRF